MTLNAPEILKSIRINQFIVWQLDISALIYLYFVLIFRFVLNFHFIYLFS